jgi:hypothetical protein
MRYHISWAFLGYISDLEVTVPFYSVYPVGEGDGRYRLEPDVIKRHSNVQMVDESRENRHFTALSGCFLFAKATVHFYSCLCHKSLRRGGSVGTERHRATSFLGHNPSLESNVHFHSSTVASRHGKKGARR